MAKIETDCDMDCVRMSFSFQRFKIGSKIVEILQKPLLQYGLSSRNCFNHLFRTN